MALLTTTTVYVVPEGGYVKTRDEAVARHLMHLVNDDEGEFLNYQAAIRLVAASGRAIALLKEMTDNEGLRKV